MIFPPEVFDAGIGHGEAAFSPNLPPADLLEPRRITRIFDPGRAPRRCAVAATSVREGGRPSVDRARERRWRLVGASLWRLSVRRSHLSCRPGPPILKVSARGGWGDATKTCSDGP